MFDRAALASGALVAAFVAGWTVNGWRGVAKSADAQAQIEVMVARLRASDDLHAAKLQEAQNETSRLRDRVSAGPVRLLVAAKCPDVPQAASAPGVDSGTRAELDPAARSAYFALRDGINRAEAKLAACQGELIGRLK